MLNRQASAESPLPALPRALLVAVMTFVFCLLAQLVSRGDPLRLLLWPAAGVAFAFGWRHGVAWTLPAAAGALGYGLFAFRSPAMAGAAAAVTLAGAAVPILILRRIGDWKPAEYRLEAVVRFLGTTLLAGAPLAALIAGTVLVLAGEVPGIHPLHLYLTAWLTVAVGTMLVAPAVLAWLDDSLPQLDAGEQEVPIVDLSGLLMAVAVAGASFALSVMGHHEYAYVIQFLFFPIVAWIAIRMDERANALTLLLAALPLLAVRAYQVPAAGDDFHRAVEASVLVFCAVVVALVLQAVAADRRLALMRVARQARQDMTTGLLNDRGLLSEFGDRLASPQRPNFGLIGVHLTNFDSVSDLCGTIPAMQLEQSTAALLLRQPGTQFAARLSAGRYALVVEADTVAQVRTVAREAYSQLAGQRYATEHGNLRLQACVGGLLIDRHALINSEDCLSSLADALAIAASVRDPQLFVEPLSQMMIDSRRAHQSKIEHIREAVRETRLELYAQPVVDPDAPAGMISYEVLTRLRDRDGGLIQPPEFLTLTVQAQMSVPFDRAVVKRAFEWLATNPQALARTHKCSINLSGSTMSDGAIAEYIRQQRALYSLPADKIVFEITESEAIRNPSAASRLVDELKAEGFGIALDDFGTGLATFEYLKRFPLDYLKIDGSFIRNLANSPIDEEIVMSTVRVARRLNLRTIAEHVHSQGVFDRLREIGVDYLQGDLFGQPQPIDTLFARFPEFGGDDDRPTGDAVTRHAEQREAAEALAVAAAAASAASASSGTAGKAGSAVGGTATLADADGPTVRPDRA
ncbi:MAG: EAL domain-containing protein [Burkholderiales bacterium]|nr:MAG: EAL domain-containing protein [Burkholderiales bacterium]